MDSLTRKHGATLLLFAVACGHKPAHPLLGFDRLPEIHYLCDGAQGITIQVLARDGRIQQTAHVSILYKGEFRYQNLSETSMTAWGGWTDSGGQVSFPDLPPGWYAASVRGGSVNVDLPRGGSVRARFYLDDSWTSGLQPQGGRDRERLDTARKEMELCEQGQPCSCDGALCDEWKRNSGWVDPKPENWWKT